MDAPHLKRRGSQLRAANHSCAKGDPFLKKLHQSQINWSSLRSPYTTPLQIMLQVEREQIKIGETTSFVSSSALWPSKISTSTPISSPISSPHFIYNYPSLSWSCHLLGSASVALLCDWSRIHIKTSQVRYNTTTYLVDDCDGIDIESSTAKTKLPPAIHNLRPRILLRISKPSRATTSGSSAFTARWSDLESYRSVGTGAFKSTVSRFVRLFACLSRLECCYIPLVGTAFSLVQTHVVVWFKHTWLWLSFLSFLPLYIHLTYIIIA